MTLAAAAEKVYLALASLSSVRSVFGCPAEADVTPEDSVFVETVLLERPTHTRLWVLSVWQIAEMTDTEIAQVYAFALHRALRREEALVP